MKDADFYSGGLDGILTHEIDWLYHDIRSVLLTSEYVFSPEHRVFADLAQWVNGVGDPLTGKTFTKRKGYADDSYVLAQRAVMSGSVALYRHGGDMRLFFWSPATKGLPVAGQRIDLVFPDRLVFSL